MIITPPQEGAPVEELWRNNVELTQAVNLLLNLTVRVSNPKIDSGKILVTEGQAVIVLE